MKIGKIINLIAEILLAIAAILFVINGQLIEACLSVIMLYTVSVKDDTALIYKELADLYNNQEKMLEVIKLQREYIKEIAKRK